jgi:hypothetical protein
LVFKSNAIVDLDSIQLFYGGNADVYQAIKYNINYIRTDRTNTPLSPSEVQTLRNVASLSDPYAAYGRALLYKLTGERIEPIVTAPVTPRSKSPGTQEVKESYSINPNPVSETLNIFIENIQIDSKYDCQIIDMMGNTVKKGSLDTHSNFNVSELTEGLYFVRILKDNQLELNQKIVIIH